MWNMSAKCLLILRRRFAPWLPQPERFGAMSVEAQDDDSSSMLNLYRQALELRKQWFADDEDIEMHDLGPDLLAFARGSGARCVVNMGDVGAVVEVDDGAVLLSSIPVAAPTGGSIEVPANAAVWLSPPVPTSTGRT